MCLFVVHENRGLRFVNGVFTILSNIEMGCMLFLVTNYKTCSAIATNSIGIFICFFRLLLLLLYVIKLKLDFDIWYLVLWFTDFSYWILIFNWIDLIWFDFKLNADLHHCFTSAKFLLLHYILLLILLLYWPHAHIFPIIDI